MNPETSPWMLIADKQRYNDLKREHEERELKNIIKTKYQKQLEDQINQQREIKKRERSSEREWERRMLNTSLENQQKVIQMEKMRAHYNSERQSIMDIENDYLKAVRKEREQFLEDQSKIMQNEANRQAQERLRKEGEEAEKKKKIILENLKQSIESKQLREKKNKMEDNQYQSRKLQEHQAINQREEHYREQYLRKLKDRARTIDYGSHEAFQKNHNKTLVQRKREEWENEQEYVRRARQLDQYEDQNRRMKLGFQNEYRDELKRQISTKNEKKVVESKRELQNDQQALLRMQNFSKSIEMSRKQTEGKTKKELLEYLNWQVEQKKRMPRQAYMMRDKQLQLNIDLIQNSKGIIPGQTYQLDPARKKQLETVAKSISYSPSRIDQNYLAQRGKTILH